MQVFSPGRHGGIFEATDAILTAMRGVAEHGNQFIHRRFGSLPRRQKPFSPASEDADAGSHEVRIMYAGHTSETLRVTSERMAIPDGRYTVGQLLCSLYKRGEQWVDELDDDNLVCTVNGRQAKLFDTIEAGAEIRISS